MIFSTFLTLVLVPVVYVMVARSARVEGVADEEAEGVA
jgi:hypothetical protein